VHREDAVAGKFLKETVFEHFACAGEALFGRLKNQIQRTVEALLARQMLRGGEQHGRVAVVTACVHLARHLARVRQTRRFVDRQRVHVGAQTQPARPVADFQLADNAGLSQSAMHGVAPLLQAFGDEIAGREFLVRKLRLRVDAMPQRDHLVFEFGNARWNGHGVHGASPLSMREPSIATRFFDRQA